MSELDAGLKQQILDLLAQGRKMEAIRIYREATGARLAPAKSVVEALARQLPAGNSGFTASSGEAPSVTGVYQRHHQQVMSISGRQKSAEGIVASEEKAYQSARSLLRRLGTPVLDLTDPPLPAFESIDSAVIAAQEAGESLREALQACDAAASKRAEMAGHLSERSEYTCVKSWQTEARKLLSRHDPDILSRDRRRADQAKGAFERHLGLRSALAESVKQSDAARYHAARLKVIAQHPTTFETFKAWQGRADTLLAEYPLPAFSQDAQRASQAAGAFREQEEAFKRIVRDLRSEISSRESIISREDSQQTKHLTRAKELWKKYFSDDVWGGLGATFGALIFVTPIIAMITGIYYSASNERGGCEQGCEDGCGGGSALILGIYGLVCLVRFVSTQQDAGKEKKLALISRQTSEDAAQELVNLRQYLSELEDVPK